MMTKQTDRTTTRSDERGIALIIVMFMVLTMSLVGASLMFVSRTETLSSLNYQTVSQVRYGSESGIAAATNYLLNTYVPPTAGGADDLANYVTSTSPVTWNGAAVVLSSNPAVASNYPVAAVKTAFTNNSSGTLSAGTGTTAYVASATLLSMRTITDAVTLNPVTLQTWRIDGTGSVAGAGSASVAVSAVLETESMPLYQYAAFSTNNGCSSLTFTGGGLGTESYNSKAITYDGTGHPNLTAGGGDVGTNGNLTGSGSETINGSLSTPRTGVGACTANNVTAETLSGAATVTGGLTQLAQPITYPTPPAASPVPPTSGTGFSKNGGCPAMTNTLGVDITAVTCTNQAGTGQTVHPLTATTTVVMGDVSVGSNSTLHLGAGTYDINSLTLTGSAQIVIDSGPVIMKVTGTNQTTPIDLTGGGISNSTFIPSNLQIQYGGTGTVKVTGGSQTAALLYAPNAAVSLTGGTTFYGAIIAGLVTDTGGSTIAYDTSLSTGGQTKGNPVLDQFSWKNY